MLINEKNDSLTL